MPSAGVSVRPTPIRRSQTCRAANGAVLRWRARSLCSPDLLLDEPTNHLDSEAIEWLQGFLAGYRGAVILVTHDRYLLEASADRIVEVEDGLTVAYNGSYGDYLIQRAERRALFGEGGRCDASRRWPERPRGHRGVLPLRATGQRARLKRLDDLREERPLLKEQTLSIDLRTGFRGGQSMIELVEASGGYDGVPLFEALTTSIQAKSCVGVLGPNGVGKSTLFKLICKELEPISGDLHWAPRLKLAVIDQARSGLKDNDTLLDAAGNGASHVTVGDQDVHVAGYLRRFLFRRGATRTTRQQPVRWRAYAPALGQADAGRGQRLAPG